MSHAGRLWVFIDAFPAVSIGFLSNRLLGLIASGWDLHIIAERVGTRDAHAISADQLELLPRVRWTSGGKGLVRIRAALQATSALFARDPLCAVAAWNPLRFRTLANGRLVTAVMAVQGVPPPDVVLACFGPLGELACSLRALGCFQAPVVTTFHGVDAYAAPARHLRARYRLLRQRGDQFVLVSRHMASALSAAGLDRRRMSVLHTPIRCADFTWRAPSPMRADAPLRLLGVGRMVEKKGFDHGLRVVQALKAQGIAVRYTIIGGGPQRDVLVALAAELGLGDEVEFTGGKPHAEVITTLAGSDILLSSNRPAANGDREGIPNVIKEAMAIGLPVVATDHAGTPELVIAGVTGLLAREGDIGALAAACRRLRDDHALACRLARAARKHVEEHFSNVVLDDRLHALLVSAAAIPFGQGGRPCVGSRPPQPRYP